MSRIQPVLSPAETVLVDQMAELTHAKRTDVIKSALATRRVYAEPKLGGSLRIDRSRLKRRLRPGLAAPQARDGKMKQI